MHHINGEGEDAGVVYCEMQARENTAEDMTHFELLQRMYPGHCGYKVSGAGEQWVGQVNSGWGGGVAWAIQVSLQQGGSLFLVYCVCLS